MYLESEISGFKLFIRYVLHKIVSIIIRGVNCKTLSQSITTKLEALKI